MVTACEPSRLASAAAGRETASEARLDEATSVPAATVERSKRSLNSGTSGNSALQST
jgi:hypothetical protein